MVNAVDVFIIGSKGIPAKYGGFETFVDRFTEKTCNPYIRYHVSCLSDHSGEFQYNNARCFNVVVPSIGSAKAIIYDIKSLLMCLKYIKENGLNQTIIYILACRIGPFLALFKRRLNRAGIKVYINPDGHEWKRSKWNKFIKAYWKYSEKLMIKHSDLLICDSTGIEDYIKREYKKYDPKTTFISYGAELKPSSHEDNSQKLKEWYEKFNIEKGRYYLIVGRFVPENNYEVIIQEFMISDSKKDLIIVTNKEENKFYKDLLWKTNFIKDNRIKFVGTVYDKELLKKIRENAFAYIHGHEVGGTNPSLLEALASTKVNILFDIIFNREVGQNAALYFTRQQGDLAQVINKVESFDEKQIDELGRKAKERIHSEYTWKQIIDRYEGLFLNGPDSGIID